MMRAQGYIWRNAFR